VRNSLPRLISLLGAALLATACAGSADSAESASSDASVSAATAPTGELSKPEVSPRSGAAPTDLVVTDLTVGEGAEAVAGKHVTVHYVGVLFRDGTQFDASWDRAAPFDFTLGQGAVIAGWDEGVAGMKVGGRRELVIPPELAYGSRGQGSIGPDETLVFVVDLLAVD